MVAKRPDRCGKPLLRIIGATVKAAVRAGIFLFKV
jgi:hypothetical protein